MKENVIIGKLIPAGTGMKRYRNIQIDSQMSVEEDIVEAEEYTDEFADEDVMATVED